MSDRDIKIRSFVEEMISVQKAFGASKDAFFRKFGLNRPQIELLYFISISGSISLKELSEKLCITSGAITQLVNGLVDLDFLERIPDEDDRRMVTLKFTENGLKRFVEFKTEHLARMSYLLSDLTDHELDLLIRIQKKIISRTIK